MTPPAPQHLRLSRNPAVLLSVAATSLALLILIVLGVGLAYQVMQQELFIESYLIFTDRPISQLQREVLRLSSLIEDDSLARTPQNLNNRRYDVRLHQAFITSRFNDVEDALTLSGDEFMIWRVQQLAEEWYDLQPALNRWIALPNDPEIQPGLEENLQDLEKEINDFSSLYAMRRSGNIATGIRNSRQLVLSWAIATSLFFLFLTSVALNTRRFLAERHKAVVALQESEELFRVLFETAPTAIVLADLQGHIQRLNQAFAQMVGYTPAALLQQQVLNLIYADQVKWHVTQYQKLLNGDVERIQSELIYIHPTGRKCQILAVLALVRNNEQKPLYLLGIFVDITQQRQAEMALHQAKRLESVGLLAGGVAHDFNNLLTGMMSQGQLAKHKLPEGHPAGENLDKALATMHRASDLTRQLLVYAGKAEQKIEPLQLNALVQENEQLLQPKIPAHVVLKVELDEEVWPIQGDKAQLQQLVMNLVINAAEAIHKPAGEVVVQTKATYLKETDLLPNLISETPLPAGNYVCLEVKDNGAGMSRETLQQIFEPFFTTKKQGHGLGLSAIMGIVRQHKGGLCVSSEPEQGTTFSVFLPVAAAF